MKQLSTSLHYAVELLSVMTAINKKEKGDDRPITLREVNTTNPIMSLNYLEQIARKLRMADILDVTRGPGGGYTISKECSDISVGDLLEADIQRHTSSKELPPFAISKALEKVNIKYNKQFRATPISEIDGFGKLPTRSKK